MRILTAAALAAAFALSQPSLADGDRPGGSGGTGNQTGRERSGDRDGDGYNDRDMASYRAMLDRYAASRCVGGGCEGNFSERERRDIRAAGSDLARQRASDRWDNGTPLDRIEDGNPLAAAARSFQGWSGLSFGGAGCCRENQRDAR